MDSSITGGRVYSKYSNTYTNPYTESSNSTDGNYLNFDQYLQLLVAKMQNQDFNDPMDDSEVLAQMAQYSMLEGIKNMTQQSNISYAMSLVGKVVTVSLGQGYITGNVDSVTIYNGEPALMINGTAFSLKSVSDVVDPELYKELKELVGKTVKTNTTNEEVSVTGKVTDVLFLYGDSYVVVNGQVYPAKYVSVIDDAEEDENGEVPEVGEDGEENVVPDTDGDDEKVPEAGETDDEAVGSDGASSNGNGNGVSGEYVFEFEAGVVDKSQTYQARSQSLVSILMKELDEVGKASSASEETDSFEDYVLQTSYVQVPEYSAGLVGDEELLALGIVVAKPVSSGSETNTISGNSSETVYTSNVGGTTYGKSTRTVTYNASNLNVYTAERTAEGNLKGVTTAASVSTGSGVPHRISVEQYPAEAALADSLGTRMYDIRFIHNTGITSRILTDKVIGYSSGGKPVTEIGYSGVGQLGEVVTFKDGTQRVEVLLSNGRSGWLTTSGNYTLDEICTKNGAPGSLAGKLTPQEKAIRHFSDPFSNMNLDGFGLSFKSQLVSNGSV